jgi:uncharacterized protein YjbI with pentapeptide repeats
MPLKIRRVTIARAIALFGSSVLVGCFPTFNIGQPQAATSPEAIPAPTSAQQPVDTQAIAQGATGQDALNQLRSTKQCPGCNLQGAKLKRTDLSGANLSNANLTRAELEKANLSNANLSGANLTKADLEDAILSGANLQNANLTRADLEDANFTGANITGANFTGAKLEDTIGLNR